MTITAPQLYLVQTSFEKFVIDIDVAAQTFYDQLFQLDASLIPMFRGDRQMQGRKLLSMVLFAVNGLHDLDTLLPQIEALGVTHREYSVMPEHYPVMGRALLWSLRSALGRDYTPEVERAWQAVWDHLSALSIEAAERG